MKKKKLAIAIASLALIGGVAGYSSLHETPQERMIKILDERPNNMSIQETREMHRLIDETCPGEKIYHGKPTVRTVQDFLKGICLQ